MTDSELAASVAACAMRIEADVREILEISEPPSTSPSRGDNKEADSPEPSVAEYDRRIVDEQLRSATRSRFESRHYADAVESGAKALNECVRAASGSVEDGDGLMTSVFSEKAPKLRINKLKSQSDRSEQRGHMLMCQGVVAAWRNPRAHSSEYDDHPDTTIAMLEHIQQLMRVSRAATKTRRRKK